jgi:hypothetical protein
VSGEDDAPPPNPATAQMAQAIATLGETMRPLLEASSGYRKQAIEMGFPEEVASLMAAEYHSALLGRVVAVWSNGA